MNLNACIFILSNAFDGSLDLERLPMAIINNGSDRGETGGDRVAFHLFNVAGAHVVKIVAANQAEVGALRRQRQGAARGAGGGEVTTHQHRIYADREIRPGTRVKVKKISTKVLCFCEISDYFGAQEMLLLASR